MQSSQACKKRTRSQQGAQAAKETNTCSPEGAHDSKHGGQTGRIHVAMQSVHAVKPGLQEAYKKPARAFKQPVTPVHAAWEAHMNLSMEDELAAYILQRVHAVKPGLQESYKKPAGRPSS
jgi:hypothetical protein